MMNYKIDFVNNTLTMSKAFEEALNNPASEEYKLWKQLRADFPSMTIIRKTRRAPQEGPPQQEPDLQAHGAVHERV